MAKDTNVEGDGTVSTPEQRIAQLEGLLKEQTEKHLFQKKRADSFEKGLAGATARLDDCQSKIDQLQQSARDALVDAVVLGGVTYDITGTYRADNTFSEVKRGHCEEGVTLVAIGKPH